MESPVSVRVSPQRRMGLERCARRKEHSRFLALFYLSGGLSNSSWLVHRAPLEIPKSLKDTESVNWKQSPAKICCNAPNVRYT